MNRHLSDWLHSWWITFYVWVRSRRDPVRRETLYGDVTPNDFVEVEGP